jgi:glycosyltransferase involved in cell wall biosynthesis
VAGDWWEQKASEEQMLSRVVEKAHHQHTWTYSARIMQRNGHALISASQKRETEVSPPQMVKWRTSSMPQTKEVLSGSKTLQESVSDAPAQKVEISVVIPAMNEEQNIRSLYEALSTQLNELGKRYEVIFIDDDSTDGTFEVLKQLYEANRGVVHVIRFRRNFSKTPALVAGFSRCRGEIILTMDGDLQDDPIEIPHFLEKLDEGYDLVSGWKDPRLDPFSKTFPSQIFNGMVSKLTGVHLHDMNCGLKAYRREIIEDSHLKLYGEFHRFVPVMAHWRGFRVTEMKVVHHPRKSGVSKYGGGRFTRGLIDLLNVLFLTTFLRKPLRLFVPLGFWTFLLGILVDLVVVIRSRFVTNEPIRNQPLLLVGILLMIFGVQFVLAGLQSEMIRHYAFRSDEEYGIRQELD